MQAIGWLRGHDWSTFGPHHIGTERLSAVSNGPSLVQVAGVILEKQTGAQNPDKDELVGSVVGVCVLGRAGCSSQVVDPAGSLMCQGPVRQTPRATGAAIQDDQIDAQCWLLRICCAGRVIRGRSDLDWAVELGWS
jgi:hypothetical protein